MGCCLDVGLYSCKNMKAVALLETKIFTDIEVTRETQRLRSHSNESLDNWYLGSCVKR
eukprot:UN14118